MKLDGDIIYKGKKINCKLSKEDSKEMTRNIQMIFQDPAASLNERATISYCIAEGLDNFKLYKDEAERQKKIDDALNQLVYYLNISLDILMNFLGDKDKGLS